MSIADEREIDCTISGKVQGVWYREFAKNRASELGIVGIIRNTDEGTVEVTAQGEEEKLKQFIKLLKNGSTFSKVENVEVAWSDLVHDRFTEFTIE